MFNQFPDNSVEDAINAYLESELDKDNQSDSNETFVPTENENCVEPSGENTDDFIVETAGNS